MDEVRIESWKAFQDEVAKLFEARRIAMSAADGRIHSEWLFRGQSQASWPLRTTLERWAGRPRTSMSTYHGHVSGILDELQSYSGHRWAIPSPPAYSSMLLEDDNWVPPLPDPLYELLVYLRHHGFPSPLLDWTASPYVAAFFAFRSADIERDVAIYSYQEYAGLGKTAWGGAPRILTLGSHVTAHERHYRQQCEYTIAIEKIGLDRSYCPHEEVFQQSKDEGERQDLLRKYVLPGGLRAEVLHYLRLHNVTAYTLFGTTESLMESLATQRFILSP